MVKNIVGNVQIQSGESLKSVKTKSFEISVGDKILIGSGSIAGIDFCQNQIKTIGEIRELTLADLKNTETGGKRYKFLENGQTWEYVTTQTSSVTTAIVGWNNNSNNKDQKTESNTIGSILGVQQVLGINEDFTSEKGGANENRIFSKTEIEALKQCIIKKQSDYRQNPESQKGQANSQGFQTEETFKQCLK